MPTSALQVGDPQLVGCRGHELAVDQVPGGLRLRVLLGDRVRPFAPMTPDNVGFAHQPSDPLAPDVEADIGELGVDPGTAVDLASWR